MSARYQIAMTGIDTVLTVFGWVPHGADAVEFDLAGAFMELQWAIPWRRVTNC